jgi:class 3 adenylate cyclase
MVHGRAAVVSASPSAAVVTRGRSDPIRSEAAALGLDVRTGLHPGEISRQGDDYAGPAVHIGASDEILVSQTGRDALVGSDIEWMARGVHVLKGVPDEWRTYAVAN